jgi:hypothetical protein
MSHAELIFHFAGSFAPHSGRSGYHFDFPKAAGPLSRQRRQGWF